MPRRTRTNAVVRAAIEALITDAWRAIATPMTCLPRELVMAGRVRTLVARAGLTEAQQDILWERAKGTPWKVLAHQARISEDTAQRHHLAALAELATQMKADQFEALEKRARRRALGVSPQLSRKRA